MIVVGVLGRPQADLPSDFLGRGRRVARDDLHGDTRVEAFADGLAGHVVAYRVEMAAMPMKVSGPSESACSQVSASVLR